MAAKRRKKKSTANSAFYTALVVVMLAAIGYLGMSVYRLLAPPPPRVEPISVLVLNGCGAPGVAHETTRYLRERGFDVVDYRNAPGPVHAETIVIDRTGDLVAASLVARDLGTRNVIQQRPPRPLEDVVVIVGSDHGRYLESDGS